MWHITHISCLYIHTHVYNAYTISRPLKGTLFWVHGEWIGARDKQITWTAKWFSGDLFVPRSDSFPMNPEKKTLIPYIYNVSQCVQIWITNCINESLFEMLNVHICTHCDTFLCEKTPCVLHVNGKGDRGYEREIQAVLNKRKNWFFQMPWFWIIRHKLKTTECEHQYGARKLCSM